MTYPIDWYWRVGGDPDNVWSSARARSVPATDQVYVDWVALPNNFTTPIPSMAELYDVLRLQWPAGSLQTYNADARYRRATSGVVVTSLSPITFLSDPVSRNTIANAYEYIKATPGNTVNWKMANGTFIVMNENQLQTAVTAIATFVQSCFTKESVNLTAINNGSMTTTAQIDAAFASISNVFP